ncbi:MAG: hypothetical protein KatS3mg105_0401 [Gemmatales bacterium]|nr:MAG: hypothetical protein KatS3mg105_0401 [Gemmatales bacterium]
MLMGIRRYLSAGLVTATALMVAVMGIPHFECRCPNGQVIPFCLGGIRNENICCCGKNAACCCARGNLPETVPSCSKCGCRQCHQANSDRTAWTKKPCCNKTFSHPEVFAGTKKEAGCKDGLSYPLASPQLTAIVSAHLTFRSWRRSSSVPPPLNRVVLLQRYLI